MSEKKVSILLVEDEQDILDMVEERFKHLGFEAYTAPCGNDAVEVLKKMKIDVVLSDFRMPNGNGQVVLDYVNTIEKDKRPLFFFVSGYADITEEEASNGGALELFSKPFDLDDMINIINVYCKKANLL